MVFNRAGVKVPFLIVDEMTTHLDATTKVKSFQKDNKIIILIVCVGDMGGASAVGVRSAAGAKEGDSDGN